MRIPILQRSHHRRTPGGRPEYDKDPALCEPQTRGIKSHCPVYAHKLSLCFDHHRGTPTPLEKFIVWCTYVRVCVCGCVNRIKKANAI